MTRFSFLIALASLSIVPACGGGPTSTTDAGTEPDAARSDAAATDAAAVDAFSADSATAPDAPAPDAAADDAATLPDAAGECTLDAQCAPGGFCRPLMTSGRACHPYQPEGATCGGFVPSYAEQRCDPDHSCVERDPRLADAPGVCALAVTVAELLADPTAYDGRVVAIVDGYVDAGPGRCTRIACPVDMPCCNTCSGTVVVRDAMDGETIELADEMGDALTCMGSECDYATMCEVTTPGRARVIGTFDATALEISGSVRPAP